MNIRDLCGNLNHNRKCKRVSDLCKMNLYEKKSEMNLLEYKNWFILLQTISNDHDFLIFEDIHWIILKTKEINILENQNEKFSRF